MDFQILRRGIVYVCSLGCLALVTTGCTVSSVRPCFTLGARGNTMNQYGIRINPNDDKWSCQGDISTDLLNAPFPMNDNTNDPNVVELPYDR